MGNEQHDFLPEDPQPGPSWARAQWRTAEDDLTAALDPTAMQVLVKAAAAKAGAPLDATAVEEAAGDSILLNDMVLAETFWTLGRQYKVRRDQLAETVRALMESSFFTFENRSVIERSLQLFSQSAAGFSDCLIVAKNGILGARTTLSFDTACLGLPGTAKP